MRKKVLIILVLFSIKAFAISPDNNSIQVQIESLVVGTGISNKNICQLCKSGYTAGFYAKGQFAPLWYSNGELTEQTNNILKLLKNSQLDGLNPDDYHLAELSNIYKTIQIANNQDQLVNNIAAFDVTFTDAVFLYLNDLANGNVNYKQNYHNWTYKSRNVNITNALVTYLSDNDTEKLLQNVLPQTHLYYTLRDSLAKYYQIESNGGFPLIPNGGVLTLGSYGHRVKLLQKRLLLTGELTQDNLGKIGVYNNNLKHAVMQFQRNNGLKVSGNVDKATLNSLNISISDRIKIIIANLNRMRMMELPTENSVALVNIPDYNLTVWNNGQNILSMNAIVGGKKHQSCVLNSQIAYLEINPYWNIPRSIAIKELLPKMIQNPDYLAQKNIDTFVIESGNRYQVDPHTVAWNSVDKINFNYFFRQNPGNSNALGHIKFVFPNSCGIYLHDTDEPNLFGRKTRDLSHGCIRISKPLVFATYLLQHKYDWNESAIESAITVGKRRVVMLPHPQNVAITYLTSWVNESGALQFRPDIYGIDSSNDAKNSSGISR